MNYGGNYHAKVKQLVAGKPNIKFARPEALWYSKPIDQHTNNVGCTHPQKISKRDGIEGFRELERRDNEDCVSLIRSSLVWPEVV
jgi:hypothetical protein